MSEGLTDQLEMPTDQEGVDRSRDSQETCEEFLRSAIYEGSVRHRRNFPKFHQFDFKLFLFFLDIDQVEECLNGRWFYSAKSIAFARFRQQDHLKSVASGGNLRDRVIQVLKQHGINQPVQKIFLLTQLRYLGFAMNPISIFYCFDENGKQLAAIAEVNNTPWAEQHLYVLPANTITGKECKQNITRERIEKDFHVSPFMSTDMFYRMVFSNPSKTLAVRIENYLTEEHHPIQNGKPGDRILEVTMVLNRVPLTNFRMNWFLLKYPLISLKAFLGIYWQAFLLFFWKQLRFYPHPHKRREAAVNSESPQSKELTTYEPNRNGFRSDAKEMSISK